jgi:uncharacterized membrane protein
LNLPRLSLNERFLKRGARFWVFPALAILFALLVAPLIRRIDAATGWELLGFSPQGAASVLGALSTAMLTFVVFVISALLVVVQLASAQLTPRIIALAFESSYIRRTMSAISFSFAYTVSVSGRIGATVPQLGVAIALFCSLISIGHFFYFANRLAIDLRPVSILTRVGKGGLKVLDSVYPNRFEPDTIEGSPRVGNTDTAKIVTFEGQAGTVLTFSQDRILKAAIAADVEIEMVPQVGDFIARGDPLFRVSAGRGEMNDAELGACAEVGPERTLEQDPRFAFRIIVDIANKALSPAINDPTTAVLAIDQIHRLLLFVGRRRLDRGEIRDSAGRVRFVYGTPDWEDYVGLGITEIRHFGAGSIQVSRRLFALLTHLLQVLPPRRAPALRRELELVHQSVMRVFPDADDRARAEVPDNQGMGGAEPFGKPCELETVEAPPPA